MRPGAKKRWKGFEGALGEKNCYADNFFAFTYDFNKDGWDDVLIYGFPGMDASWYENPKKTSDASLEWKRHKVFDVVDNESPTFADLTGDGKPEIVCSSNGVYGYATPDWSDTTKPWKFHPSRPTTNIISSRMGLGWRREWRWKDGLAGEIRVVGATRLIQMATRFGNTTPRRLCPPSPRAAPRCIAYDVNGDGLQDVVTSLAAHDFGLAWFEQLNEKSETGEPAFKQHLIMGKTGGE